MTGFEFAGATLALIAERLMGYPGFAYRRIRHPVEWLGRLVAALDDHLNDPEAPAQEGRLRGLLALVIIVAATLGAAMALTWFIRSLPLGWIIEAVLAIPFLAQKSLREHVNAVVKALNQSLAQGRAAVSMIVGRDPAHLDESGVSRAALESLAENASDGVVAPLFWFILFGLPGIAVYKAINTADSMIGHKSERHLNFGWAAAKLDDLVNLPGSRLTGLLLAGAAATISKERGREALNTMLRDASKHVSPNAGWPEAATAGALGLALAGPRAYGGVTVEDAFMGDGRREANAQDIRAALALYRRADMILIALVALIAIIALS